MLIKLNAPARNAGLQLTEAGVLQTQCTACVHVHVKRAINCAKTFTIFDKVIPLSLAESIHQKWTLCCLLKFQTPLRYDYSTNQFKISQLFYVLHTWSE